MSIRKIFLRIIKNQLVSGGAVLFFGNLIVSAGGYFYHLLMGRMLGVVDYGILASLFSLSSLFGIPTAGLTLVLVREISSLRGKSKLEEASFFYSWILKKFFIFSFLLFLILLCLSPFFLKLLHLDSISLLLIIITASIVSIFVRINESVFQAFLRFKLMSFLGILAACLKIIGAVVLVFLGFSVLGAISAFLLSLVFGLFLSFPLVKKILCQKKKKFRVNGRRILKYALPVFLSTLAFTSMYTIDVVLARHFLSSQDAGFYASLSTLGKIIFFASGPISMAMFPMVVQRHANGENYTNLLILAFGLVVLICLGTSTIYFLFPSLMIRLLFGRLFLGASYALGFFALFMSFYSLSYILVNFSLSIGRVKVVFLPVMAAILQVAMILLFHKSLVQIVGVSIFCLGLLLAGLIFYNFIRDKKVIAQFIQQIVLIRDG